MGMEDGGEPAFPVRTILDKDVGPPVQHTGMTLRDYFAAKAMQAIIPESQGGNGDIAEAAYEIADAMLEVRERA